MEDSKLTRINELYKKSQETGLTSEEKEEQVKLRSEYIQSVRNNLRGTLNQISLLNPDGTVTELSKKDKH
jgi:uncharacterized protein YnzC (UPF0291/DUF896 family)